MSAIYRFGFEHGNVPSGVTINNGSYYWMGRKGNCSLYGDWPNITCSTPSTTEIRGSLYVLSFAHDLNNVEHLTTQSFVEFGNVKLQSNGSGAYAINIGGSDVAVLSNIDFYRGEWVPLRFKIDLGNPSSIELEIKGQQITTTNATTLSAQTSIRIGGFGGRGNLEDIALNIGAGGLDTDIPQMVSCVSAFYTGIGDFDDWLGNGSVGSNFSYFSTKQNTNTIGGTYCPYNNRFYLGGGYVDNGYTKYIDLYNMTLNNWFECPNNSYIQQVVYSPSSNTIFYSTGTRDINEIDLQNNILSSHISSYNLNERINTVYRHGFYNAKTNRIYTMVVGNNITNSTTNNVIYIDCGNSQTGSINLGTNVYSNFDSYINGHIFSDYLYFLATSTTGLLRFNVTNNTISNTNILVGNDVGIIQIPEIGSGILSTEILGLTTDRNYLFFNLDTNEIKRLFIQNMGNNTTNPTISYSKISNNILIKSSVTSSGVILNLSNTGDITFINGLQTVPPQSFSKPDLYCPYNDTSILIYDTNLFYEYISHSNKILFNNESYKYKYIQYDDIARLKSYYLSTGIYKTLSFTGSSYEGTNIYLKTKKQSLKNPLLMVGINEDNQNISLSKFVPSGGIWQTLSFSSLYAQDGSKLTVDQGNNIKSYFEYSGLI